MSAATLAPPAGDFGDDFDRLTADLDLAVEERRPRWVSQREPAEKGSGFRRHRTREARTAVTR